MEPLKEGRVRLGGRRFCTGRPRREPGEIVAVIAPTGPAIDALKVDGLIAPEEGSVAIGSRPLANFDRRALGREIAYLPQERAVHWPLTVRRLVALGRLPFRTRRQAKQR
jgi:iron complex transport system ATP-binding protein